MCTVSIIVPVYNVEKYLHCCVDSILAQTFKDIEVLLVDDGSTDGSGAICDDYALKDSRVRAFHKENGGVSSARNTGLEEAIGKWIMFVDSDDKVSPMICERLLLHAVEGCMPLCLCYEWKNNEVNLISVGLDKGNYPIERFNDMCAYGPCARFYEKELVDRVDLRFSERFTYAEDAIFNYEYYELIDRFIIIDEPLYYYRILPNSLSHGRYIPDLEIIVRATYQKRLHLAERLKQNTTEFYKSYYGNYLLSIYVLFENNMHPDSPGTWIQKMRRNNKVLRSKEFKMTFPYRYERPKDFTKRYIHMLELSYHTGSYFWLWLLGVPGKIKEAITGKR